MTTIYLVVGETGEYSDHRDWYVGWSADKDKAEALCHKCSLEAQDFKRRDDADPCGYIDRAIPSDPDFQMDYTGTRYFVVEVPEIA